ncbi:MAG TPA: hypothetical protein VHO28_04820, partial [Ignavibacteriales bacterium]|nr:hypothetical protein [Ignavibacteriales bacterium]
TKTDKPDYVLWTIRILLILSIVGNLATIIWALIDNEYKTKTELAEPLSKKAELFFWAVFTFVLTYLHDFFKNRNIHLPRILEVIIIIYIYAGIFLSARWNLYYKFIWWDMLLHTFSGMLLAFLGFLAIYKINMKYSMDISPLLAAAFAFGFSMSANVFFEIYEFSIDVIFGTALQSWDLSEKMLEIGKPYQGSGLRDTMSDFICDTTGAALMSVFCFFLYKNEKKRTLQLMKEIFPNDIEHEKLSV